MGCQDVECDAPEGFRAAGTCCRHVRLHGILGRGWGSTCVVLGRLKAAGSAAFLYKCLEKVARLGKRSTLAVMRASTGMAV